MLKQTSHDRKSTKPDARALRKLRRVVFSLLLCSLLAAFSAHVAWVTHSQTANGEIENRPSPTFRRICQGGGNAGQKCKQNSECPGSTCTDRNVFNINVAVLYNASATDITAIRNMITAMSARLLDITDGQAQIGTATIHNNAINTNQADLEIHPASNPVWWNAQTGSFRTGGTISVSINNVLAAANPGDVLTHEVVHLIFDARDEYESRPAGCVEPTVDADCPVPASGDATCLMDSNGTELCWGQANAGNLTDLTNGNHDPTNVTEQSVCRSNRNCWDQVVWSWPTTFLKPTGAPNAESNGVVVNPTNFIMTNNNVRVVLVLDESGSMSQESPSRMERLKVAARDFIATAQNGTELGLVSFATDAEVASGRSSVSIAALGADRSAWTNEVNNFAPATRTNIGAGLQKAKDMITAAGGVTANTYIVLMTDGLNNEPGANAAADLQAKINDLMASNIPVFVTCTGGDLGLQSQCSEIAAGTNGFFSDSADAARMPQTFVDFQERITGHQGIASFEGTMAKNAGRESNPISFLVDEGSESSSFSVLWDNKDANARVRLIDPGGNEHQMGPIPQGVYARISNPVPGEWKMQVVSTGADSRFFARGYVHNRVNNLAVSTRWPSRKPGEEMYVYAYPKSKGGSITEPGAKLTARVTRPDGSADTLELFDNGRTAPNQGDDLAGDGIFTGIYKNTGLKGAYGFQVGAAIDRWHLSNDPHKRDPNQVSPRFIREVRLSSASSVPGEVPTTPEDDRPPRPGGGDNPNGPGGLTGTGGVDWKNPCCWLLIIALILLLIALILLWRCHRSRRTH